VAADGIDAACRRPKFLLLDTGPMSLAIAITVRPIFFQSLHGANQASPCVDPHQLGVHKIDNLGHRAESAPLSHPVKGLSLSVKPGGAIREMMLVPAVPGDRSPQRAGGTP
jgi:hypothetical protein